MKTKAIDERTKFLALYEKGFVYDPETGLIISPKGEAVTGRKLGWVYIHTKVEMYGEKIDCQTYAHRYGFWFMTGQIPEMIDHKNRMRSDNRFENLRTADHILNANNRSMTKGFIIQDKVGGTQYLAHIISGGKRIPLGTYNTPTEAYIRYYQAKHGESPSKEKIYRMLNNLN
jgi:hypothetical protein